MNREHSVLCSRYNSTLDVEFVAADVAGREAEESKMDEAVDPSQESKRGGRASESAVTEERGERERRTNGVAFRIGCVCVRSSKLSGPRSESDSPRHVTHSKFPEVVVSLLLLLLRFHDPSSYSLS